MFIISLSLHTFLHIHPMVKYIWYIHHSTIPLSIFLFFLLISPVVSLSFSLSLGLQRFVVFLTAELLSPFQMNNSKKNSSYIIFFATLCYIGLFSLIFLRTTSWKNVIFSPEIKLVENQETLPLGKKLKHWALDRSNTRIFRPNAET